MWMVWSHDNGLVLTTDNKQEAEKVYDEEKQWYKNSFDDEFTTDEHVVLAKIEKQFYSEDTKQPVYEEAEDGEEIETGDTYWDWKEDIL
ncbi:MAG: hypothetical protein K0Q87_105 [Neobacillus sp.]|nr:hypothetical protein [Neobacillus sp.]